MSNRILTERDRFLLAERYEAAKLYEATLAQQGLVPNVEDLPHRKAATVLKLCGAAAIAVNIAIFTLLGCFILFNKMLHVSF